MQLPLEGCATMYLRTTNPPRCPTVPQRVALSVVGSGVRGRCVLRALRKRRRLRVQEINNQSAQWPFMVIINI